MNVIGQVTVLPELPPSLARLSDLAYNLYWSWTPRAQALYEDLDASLWDRLQHNPVRLLLEVPQARLDEAAANPYLVSTLRTLRLHLARLRRLAADDPARLAASAAEHADIADAVGSGAADLAEATTRVHLHHAFHHLTRRGRAEETPTLLTPTEGDRP